jgi:hypothetical protein
VAQPDPETLKLIDTQSPHSPEHLLGPKQNHLSCTPYHRVPAQNPWGNRRALAQPGSQSRVRCQHLDISRASSCCRKPGLLLMAWTPPLWVIIVRRASECMSTSSAWPKSEVNATRSSTACMLASELASVGSRRRFHKMLVLRPKYSSAVCRSRTACSASC